VALVVVTTMAFSQDADALAPLADAGHEVRFIPTGPGATAERVVEALTGASAVVAQTEPYTAEVLDRLPDLKVIARSGVGFDAIDVPPPPSEACSSLPRRGQTTGPWLITPSR
jgi:D-3-phosphoglycerate dehydrogenase